MVLQALKFKWAFALCLEENELRYFGSQRGLGCVTSDLCCTAERDIERKETEKFVWHHQTWSFSGKLLHVLVVLTTVQSWRVQLRMTSEWWFCWNIWAGRPNRIKLWWMFMGRISHSFLLDVHRPMFCCLQSELTVPDGDVQLDVFFIWVFPKWIKNGWKQKNNGWNFVFSNKSKMFYFVWPEINRKYVYVKKKKVCLKRVSGFYS